MPGFELVPDRCKVWISGRTNLHPVEASATGVAGYVDATIEQGRLALSSPPAGRIELPVDRITSNNALFVREMHRRIEARKFPTIVGELRATDEGSAAGRYGMSGDLTFHGVTRSVSGDVAVTSDGTSLTLEGEQTFDIRDFGLEAPRLLVLKADPEITVRIRFVARAGGAAAQEGQAIGR